MEAWNADSQHSKVCEGVGDLCMGRGCGLPAGEQCCRWCGSRRR